MTSPSSSPQASSHTVASAYSEWLDPRFRKLLAAQMAFGYAFSALLIVPKYADVALHASPRQIGELTACNVLAVLLAAPLCGPWLDRGGWRSAMLVGSAVLAASTAALGFVCDVGPLLYALRLLNGFGNALVTGGSGVLVTRLVPASHHGRAFGTAGAAALMMNAVASSATERLADGFGWIVAFEVAAGASVAAFALTATLSTAEPPADPPLTTLAPGGAAKAPAAVGVGALAAGAGFGMLATFTQPYALSLGAEHVSRLFVGYTLTALLVRLGFGGAVDRWGRRPAAVLAVGLYAASTAAAAALRPEWLFALGLGFGAAQGLAWPSLSALAVEHAPPSRAGGALTRLYAMFSAGALLALWGGGRLIAALGYPLSFLIAGAAVACGALGLALSGRPVRPSV